MIHVFGQARVVRFYVSWPPPPSSPPPSPPPPNLNCKLVIAAASPGSEWSPPDLNCKR